MVYCFLHFSSIFFLTLCLNSLQLDLPLQIISVIDIEYCQWHLKNQCEWLTLVLNLIIQILSNISNYDHPFLALYAIEVVSLRKLIIFLHDYNIYTAKIYNEPPADTGNRTPNGRTLLHCNSTNLVLTKFSLTVSTNIKLHARLVNQTKKKRPSTYVWKKYLSSLLVEDIVGCWREERTQTYKIYPWNPF